jgi:hypothetical protein
LESLWDELVQRSDQRQLFIGGRTESALIYSPLLLADAKLTQQLHSFLKLNADIHVFRIELVELQSLHRLTVKTAAIEAISQAQRYLADRMALSRPQALHCRTATKTHKAKWSNLKSATGN